MAIHGPTVASTFLSQSEELVAFKLGNSYAVDDIVVYSRGLYQAVANIGVALNVPPADRDNWKEFFAHGLESYGEHLVDAPGKVNLAPVNVPVQAAEGSVSLRSFAEQTQMSNVGDEILPGSRVLGLRGATNLFSVHSEQLRSDENGLRITFPSAVDLNIQFLLQYVSVSQGPIGTTLEATLQARVDSGDDWEDVKTGSVAIHGTVATGTLSNASDVSFIVRDGQQVEFRWKVRVSIGGFNSTRSDGEVRITIRTQVDHYLPFTIQRRASSNFSIETLADQTVLSTQTLKAGINHIDGTVASVLDFTGLTRNLDAGEDLTITFHSGDNLVAHYSSQFAAAADITLTLQGKKTTDTDWTDIKSGTHSFSQTGNHNSDITLSNSSSVSFDLADGESLEFQWEVEITNNGETVGGGIRLATGSLLLYSINDPTVYLETTVNLIETIPESFAVINDDGAIESSIDGLTIVVPSDTGVGARLTLDDSIEPAAGGGVNVSTQLQAKLNNGEWQNLKSHTADLANDGEDSVNDFSLGLSHDVTFNLDTDDTLSFRWRMHVREGSIETGGLRFQPGQRLALTASGNVGTYHLVVYGTGANEGKLYVIDQLNDVEQAIIDIENGVNYIGPTKLAGLSDSLSDTEKAAIRTKLEVPAMSDLTGAIFIIAANVSVASNVYTLTSGQSLTSYETGQEFIFVAKADSTDGVTVNIDGIGAKELHDSDGQIGDAGSDISDGDVLRIVYDGDDFLVFESGDQDASEVPTSVTDFDGLLSSDPATVQAALNVLDDVDATDIPVDASGFDGNLASTDNTVQKALQKFDDLTTLSGSSLGSKSAPAVGAGNAIALTPSPGITAYRDGLQYVFTSPITNTGSVTISVSGLNAQLLRSTKGVLEAGDLVQNNQYMIVYAGTMFLLVNYYENTDEQDASEVPTDIAEYDEFGTLTNEATVQKALETLSSYRQITSFEIGADYNKNQLVRYQDVLYRATQDITDASAVPPLDTNEYWDEITSHRLEGYGEIEDETEGSVRMDSLFNIPAQAAADNTYTQELTLTDPDNLPQGIVSIEEGYFIAHVDGVVITFEEDDDWLVRLYTTASDNARAKMTLEYQKNSGVWTRLRALTADVDHVGQSLTQTNFELETDSDLSVTLDTDDTLKIRLILDVVQGSIGTTILLPPGFADTPWRFLVTGIRETRHILAHGTGDNDGKIVVEDSTDGTITPIIDIDDGVDYVGPTKLSGLADDLTNSEKDSIRTKINAGRFLYNPSGNPALVQNAGSINSYLDGTTTPTPYTLSEALDLSKTLFIKCTQDIAIIDSSYDIISIVELNLRLLRDSDFDSEGFAYLISAKQNRNPSSGSNAWALFVRIDEDNLDRIALGSIDESNIRITRIWQE